MENKGFQEIRQKCHQFKKLLLNQKQNLTVDSVAQQVKQIMQNNQVLSLTRILQHNSKKQIKIPLILQPGTSCYSSDMCSDDEPSFDKTDDEKKHKKTLTYTQIESMLIDEQSFDVVEDQKSIWVLVQNIRQSLDYYEFVNFLENLQQTPEISQLYFCFFQEKYSVIIQFCQFKQMEKFCNSCFKGLTNFIALFGNNFKILWVNPKEIDSRSPSTDVDLLYYGSLKKKKRKQIFFGQNFVGVIIRNYPINYDCNELKQLLQKRLQIECKLKQQIEFKKQRFALLTFNTIEDAEKSICWMKERSTDNDFSKLKINLHSFSNYTRDPLIKNVYGKLFKSDVNKEKLQQILQAIEVKKEDTKIQQNLLKDPKNSINFESEPEEGEINQTTFKQAKQQNQIEHQYSNNRRQQYRRNNVYSNQQQNYEYQRDNRNYDRNYRRNKIRKYDDYNKYRKQLNLCMKIIVFKLIVIIMKNFVIFVLLFLIQMRKVKNTMPSIPSAGGVGGGGKEGKIEITKPPAPKEILPPKQIIIAPMIIKPGRKKIRYAQIRSGPDIYSNAHGFLGPPYSPSPLAYTGMPFNYGLKSPRKIKLQTHRKKHQKKKIIRKLLSQLKFTKTNNDTDAFNDYMGLEHQKDLDFKGSQYENLENLEKDKRKNMMGVIQNYYTTKLRPSLQELDEKTVDLATQKTKLETEIDQKMNVLIKKYKEVQDLEKELDAKKYLI